eukprot:Skav207925  [mRNA]  locus=scaffold1441:30889:33754:+ [translate_table: standard]
MRSFCIGAFCISAVAASSCDAESLLQTAAARSGTTEIGIPPVISASLATAAWSQAPVALSRGVIFLALELATVLALAPGTAEWGQLAYGFTLLGAVLAVMVMADPWSNGGEASRKGQSYTGHLPSHLTFVVIAVSCGSGMAAD